MMSSYENATNSRAIEFASIRLTALVPAAAGHKIGAPSADLGGANRQRRDLLCEPCRAPGTPRGIAAGRIRRAIEPKGDMPDASQAHRSSRKWPQLSIEMSSGARALAPAR